MLLAEPIEVTLALEQRLGRNYLAEQATASGLWELLGEALGAATS